MLVLTRKLNEQIQIGNDITITVVRVKGNTVRVGIDAPRDVRVIRAELPQSGAGEPVPKSSEHGTATGEAHTAPADTGEDGDIRTPSHVRHDHACGPLAEVMQQKSTRNTSSQSQPPQRHAAHGDATSDDAIGSLQLNSRRRAPGEKPAVLPRLPRLGPASPHTNRLAAYDQVRALLE